MDGTTPWWQSKTIWGSAIAILASILALFGLNLDASLQSQLVDIVVAIGGVIGGALAWYGRVVATKKIG